MNYGKQIDPVIYSEACKGFGPREWLALAIAAADQAGLTAGEQSTIRCVFEAHGVVESPSATNCPKCGSDEYAQRKYRAPGVAADDYTCAWMQCESCGHKTDPC